MNVISHLGYRIYINKYSIERYFPYYSLSLPLSVKSEIQTNKQHIKDMKEHLYYQVMQKHHHQSNEELLEFSQLWV